MSETESIFENTRLNGFRLFKTLKVWLWFKNFSLQISFNFFNKWLSCLRLFQSFLPHK